jgi:ABC-type dipeptide/oligopeptide/nickel transport system permease subunit
MTEQTQIPAFEASNVQLELRPRTLWGDARERLRGSRIAMTCLIITAAYVLAALTSFLPFFEHRVNDIPRGKIWDIVGGSFQPPTFVITSPEGGRTVRRLAPPALWLGTDLIGRSILWQTLYGSRVALEITAGASILAIGIGLVLGVVAGYFGGWVDNLIIWLFTTVSSVPWILLVIALVYALEGYAALKDWLGGIGPVILALGLTDWVGLCRLIRGEVLALRQRDFVVAAKAAGLGDARILFRHIVPNVTHILIITFSLGAVGYVQAEVVLSFLGIGISNRPSWGRMIDDAKLELLRGVWWPATAATIAILVISLALNYLGDILRDALDPRLRGVG